MGEYLRRQYSADSSCARLHRRLLGTYRAATIHDLAGLRFAQKIGLQAIVENVAQHSGVECGTCPKFAFETVSSRRIDCLKCYYFYSRLMKFIQA